MAPKAGNFWRFSEAYRKGERPEGDINARVRVTDVVRGAIPTADTEPTHPYSDSEASRHSTRERLKKIATIRADEMGLPDRGRVES